MSNKDKLNALNNCKYHHCLKALSSNDMMSIGERHSCQLFIIR